jgi:hypothetical protein
MRVDYAVTVMKFVYLYGKMLVTMQNGDHYTNYKCVNMLRRCHERVKC